MMQHDVLVTGGRIFDPSQNLDITGDLLIRNGLIHSTGKHGTLKPQQDAVIVKANGFVVCPGFIDLHCHLREPGYEDKETIRTGTMAAAAGGFTTVCCMPNTNPPIDNKASIEFIKRTAEQNGKIRVLPVACITKGRKGAEITEMQELKEEGAAGFSDDGNSVPGSKVMMLAMEYCRNLDMVIMEHCEDKEIAGDGTINEGWVSVRLGLKGIPSEAEEIIVARDLALAKLTGSRLHISHASTKGTVELIRKAKESGINVSAEVTPHHLLLTEETVIRSQWDNGRYSAYNTNVKVNPPLRTQSDVDALIAGLNEGIIDAIATDHAPHTSVDKLCEMDHAAFGISGLETAFGGLMILVHTGRIGLRTLIAALTCKPASILPESVRNLGSLAPGNPADVTLIDIDRTWRVNIEEFYSKGKNSPFNKFEFKGKVMATIYGGKIVYGEGCRQMENTNG